MIRSIIILLVITVAGCKPSEQTEVPSATSHYTSLRGQVIGTYYALTYSSAVDVTETLDSLFVVLNESLSTYVPTSTISRLNQSDSVFTYSLETDRHFLPVLDHAYKLHKLTSGAFDPTVMPLVNFWGFGYQKVEEGAEVDSSLIPDLVSTVGLDRVSYTVDKSLVTIRKPEKAEMDFSANAKGYYIDQVGKLLQDLGINNYLVDIGGESVARGVNNRGKTWTIGINTPSESSSIRAIERALQLDNAATATSGNYRNFRVTASGSKYVHTVDPTTGYAIQSDILSATIVAPDCATADALATACIVKGKEQALLMLEQIDSVEGYLIFAGDSNYQQAMTSGFGKMLLE